MAGDWIPMRLDLSDDPAVIRIAAELGIEDFSVVGRLHRLWSWANRHLSSGRAEGVTEQWIDRYVAAAGFAAALSRAGWLHIRSGYVEFANFDRWNSQGAKQRLQTTKRKQKERIGVTPVSQGGHANVAPMSRSQRDETVTREEKRREEKKEDSKTPPPPAKPGGVGEADSDRDWIDSLVVEEDPGEQAVAIANGVERPPPLADFLAAWVAERLKGHDALGGIRETSHRRGWWQERVRDPWWAANWRDGVRRLGRSQKARGLSAAFGGVGVDVFLRDPDTLARALEGTYDDPGGSPSSSAGAPPRSNKFDAVIAEFKAKAGQGGPS